MKLSGEVRSGSRVTTNLSYMPNCQSRALPQSLERFHDPSYRPHAEALKDQDLDTGTPRAQITKLRLVPKEESSQF